MTTQETSTALDHPLLGMTDKRQPDGSSRTRARTARFWDRIAKRYARKPVPDEAVYQRKLDLTREYFTPDMNVLEFGCGTGSTAIAHATQVGDILAIDVSSEMIEIAQKKAAAANIDNATVKCATLDDVQVAEASLDAVLGLSILHLLKDWELVIEQVYAMLKPGGVFVTSTPCLADNQGFLKLILPLGHRLGLLPDVRFFTRRALESRLTEVGFKLDNVWQPAPRQSVFIVAKKADSASVVLA